MREHSRRNCVLLGERPFRRQERRLSHGGFRDHHLILEPGRACHRRDRRQVRPLLPAHRPEHPDRPRGRGGVCQRHLSAGVDVHPAPAPPASAPVAGSGGAQPGHQPVAQRPRPEAVRRSGSPVQRAGGVHPLRRDGGAALGGRGADPGAE